MEKVVSRLVRFFTIILLLLAALGLMGLVLIATVPAEESHLGALRVPLLGICAALPLIGVFIAVFAVKSVAEGMSLHEESLSKDKALYEQILDAIPFPITVTDIDMRWLFVNKPVCDMLNKERREFYGKHCSSWGAAICNTEKCGIACLRNGKASTEFTQFGSDYHVDVFYLFDGEGNRSGHIEFVRDITTETALKRQRSEVVGYLASLSDSLFSASNRITDGSQTLAQGAADQAASVGELSEAVSDINRLAKENTQATTEALEEVQGAYQLMVSCREQMGHMLEAMGAINEKSQNIYKTTKVIDDIALQTNILALNAAVEAARAGQYGKGFAVVAEKVRNLAARSAEAARETATLIESSFQSVTSGNEIVERVNESLNAVVEGAQKNAAQIAEIQAVSAQQSEDMAQIATNIAHMSSVIEQNSATAEELASTSADMNDHADKLHTTILGLSNSGA